MSDQEGYALLIDYIRRQWEQEATSPHGRRPPPANAGPTPTAAGLQSVVGANSSPSKTGPLNESGVMGSQAARRSQLTVGETWKILHAPESPRPADGLPHQPSPAAAAATEVGPDHPPQTHTESPCPPTDPTDPERWEPVRSRLRVVNGWPRRTTDDHR